MPEGTLAAGGASGPGVVAELVGYGFEAEPGGPPRVLGRGPDADVRLHNAPIALEAAYVLPPHRDDPFWTVYPTRGGLTLKLLADSADGRVRETSFRPWAEARGLPFRAPRPESVTLGCANPTATVTPVRLDRAPWIGSWGARVRRGEDDQLRTPWSESPQDNGLGVSVTGPRLSSIRLQFTPLDPPKGTLQPGCAGDSCIPASVPVCAFDSDEPTTTLGPLSLRDGDLLAVGRTRFLVRTEAQQLELLHVRQPRSPGYFRSSSGHDVYHPNRRAMWTVPSCDGGRKALTLAVKPSRRDADLAVAAADLPLSDRRTQGRIAAAAVHHGVPHDLPPVVSESVRDRALLTLCAARRSGRRIDLLLTADSPRAISLRTADGMRLLGDGAVVPIGSRRRPGEVLVTMDGHLVRVAPAAGARVTRRTRLGLAGYLIFVLLLQAVPLTRARMERRRAGLNAAWPVEAGAPTLQQLAGAGISVLLFVGASFQLFLALHPELAGKPDYAQAFLQGVVVVSVVLAAAAGFAVGRVDFAGRCAGAALGAALALLGAAAWWWWDGRGVPDAFWLSELRNRAVAASGAGPAGAGKLLLQGSAVGLAVSAAFVLSGALRWTRAAERGARLGLRLPVAGFILLAAVGLALGLLQGSALAFELAILAGLAWYAAVYWAFVRRGRLPHDQRLRRRAAFFSLASGVLMLLFLIAFFVVGAELPDGVSFALVASGVLVLGHALAIILAEKYSSLLRVLALWLVATLFGCAFASVLLTDMGSVAAWVPAVLAGLFLWLVRPEEQESREEEPRKAASHLLLALGIGLVLLGLLDVFKTVVQGLEWQALERPRQRLDLAEDVSYITPGEWITQVRWLASQHDDAFQWVPNVNSDIAIFGLVGGLGTWLSVAASLVLLGIAGCTALAADQALREAHATAAGARGDRLYPALYRALGLFSGMVAVLLVAQWLVHLATGVVLHLPITGLVFPWVSHGNTTHVLYAAAIVLPMAAVTALGDCSPPPSIPPRGRCRRTR